MYCTYYTIKETLSSCCIYTVYTCINGRILSIFYSVAIWLLQNKQFCLTSLFDALFYVIYHLSVVSGKIQDIIKYDVTYLAATRGCIAAYFAEIMIKFVLVYKLL